MKTAQNFQISKANIENNKIFINKSFRVSVLSSNNVIKDKALR